MHAVWAWLLVLPVLSAGDQAQTYTIKLKNNPDVGKSVVHKDMDKYVVTVKVSDAGGKVLREAKPSESKEFEYTLTVQDKGDKHPKKYTQKFTKAVEDKDGKSMTRSWEGRTVIYELVDGKYKVKAEGAPELPEKDLEFLAGKANEQLKSDLDKVLLPKKAVKVGDSWPINARELANTFGNVGELDFQQTKVEGKLVKVYQKDGSQFGVIDFTMKLACKTIMPGNLKFDPPVIFDFKATLDTGIDGSSTAGVLSMTGKMAGKTTVDNAGMKFNLDIAMMMSLKTEHSGEK
jgi:hypothetical protein